jgi:hypothetical protein
MKVGELVKALKSQDSELDVVAAGRFMLEGRQFHLTFDLEKVLLNQEEGYVEIRVG